MDDNSKDDKYFKEHGQSKTLYDALSAFKEENGSHSSSLLMWQDVANGKWNCETRLWCQEVAKQLLIADQTEDKRRRADTVLKAVGLAGRKNEFIEIDEICSRHMAFTDLEAAEDESNTQKVKAIVDELLAKGLVTEDSEIEQMVRRRMSEIKKQGFM